MSLVIGQRQSNVVHIFLVNDFVGDIRIVVGSNCLQTALSVFGYGKRNDNLFFLPAVEYSFGYFGTYTFGIFRKVSYVIDFGSLVVDFNRLGRADRNYYVILQNFVVLVRVEGVLHTVFTGTLSCNKRRRVVGIGNVDLL